MSVNDPCEPISRATWAHAVEVSISVSASPAPLVVVENFATVAFNALSLASLHANSFLFNTLVQRSLHCTSVRDTTCAAIFDHGRGGSVGEVS